MGRVADLLISVDLMLSDYVPRLAARFGQKIMYGIIAALVPLYYLIGIKTVEDGQAFAMAGAIIIASPVAMWFIRKTVERYDTEGMFALVRQSLAFVVGDTFVLPLAMIASVRGWQAVEVDSYFMSWRWAVASFALGVLAAILFHKSDRGRYYEAGWEAALKSPTKVWHDFAVYPLLVALFIWSIVPQLGNFSNFNTMFAIYLLGVWGLLGIWDVLVRKISPVIQHPRWDSRRFKAF